MRKILPILAVLVPGILAGFVAGYFAASVQQRSAPTDLPEVETITLHMPGDADSVALHVRAVSVSGEPSLDDNASYAGLWRVKLDGTTFLTDPPKTMPLPTGMVRN